MNIIDCKISIRTFLKNKKYNFLNIIGLTIGLAAFIFVALYVNNETSYDKWNKNRDQIFLIERETSNGPSPFTPGSLAAAVKSQCPEVVETGRVNTALFQIPFYTASGRFLIKKWVGADYSIAKILGIKPKGFTLNPKSSVPTILLSRLTASALFPNTDSIQNKMVNMMSKSGMPILIAGMAEAPPGNTVFNFDCIGFSPDITEGKDQSYATQIYQTYVLVKPNTDINLLTKKIDKAYREGAKADTNKAVKDELRQSSQSAIYLDPLKHLHLKPHYGSAINDQIVKSLLILATIILLVTGINFTNLFISQASKRSKEVGIKKVNGLTKSQIAMQFLAEIVVQCLVALVAAFGLVTLGLPFLNQLLQVSLSISQVDLTLTIQLILTLTLLVAIAGIYPAIVMANFNLAEVMRGNQLYNGGKLSWVQNTITIFQFTFAVTFITMMIVINNQVTFMKTNDPGFTAKQVIYIDNLALYDTPNSFKMVRNRIKAISGVKNVTVASTVPGGAKPPSYEYAVQSKILLLNTVGVDYEYFETLSIKMLQGRLFTADFHGDSTGAIINEAALATMNLKNPIGKKIKGCAGDYTIIGVSKNVKAYGYEENIQPTIYLLNQHCGTNAKIQIMVNAENGTMPLILKKLGQQWSDINKLDGDSFNYHFLDQLYGQLFTKQEQLQLALVFFSILSVLVAALGLFSSAAQSIQIRGKEIAVRKILGANFRQLTLLLTRPFLYMVLAANLISLAFSVIIANKWLQTFAYQIQLSATPFLITLVVTLFIIVITVCLQTFRAVRLNLAVKIKV